jgi:hypothetical protein
MVCLTASGVESSCPAVTEWYVSNSIVCQLHRLQIIGWINVNVPLGMEENEVIVAHCKPLLKSLNRGTEEYHDKRLDYAGLKVRLKPKITRVDWSISYDGVILTSQNCASTGRLFVPG